LGDSQKSSSLRIIAISKRDSRTPRLIPQENDPGRRAETRSRGNRRSRRKRVNRDAERRGYKNPRPASPCYNIHVTSLSTRDPPTDQPPETGYSAQVRFVEHLRFTHRKENVPRTITRMTYEPRNAGIPDAPETFTRALRRPGCRSHDFCLLPIRDIELLSASLTTFKRNPIYTRLESRPVLLFPKRTLYPSNRSDDLAIRPPPETRH